MLYKRMKLGIITVRQRRQSAAENCKHWVPVLYNSENNFKCTSFCLQYTDKADIFFQSSEIKPYLKKST
jgi:hypothetical protein